MARPIRWDNVQVPSAGGALGAFDAGADRISQSINDLRSLAQEQTNVNQTNYEAQKERNTANIIDQLNRATSQEALSGVDSSQFGNQVDQTAINQVFGSRQDTLIDRNLEQQKFQNVLEQQEINNDLNDRKLQLQQQQANQYGFKYENGQILREDPNTGRVEHIGNYTVPPKTTNTAAGIQQQKDLLSSSYRTLETLKRFEGDANAYGDFLTTQLAKRTDLSTEEANKVRTEALKFHEEYYNSWSPEQRQTFETQERYGQQALKQFEGEMEAIQEEAAQTLGARPEVFNYRNDTETSLETVSKRYAPRLEWALDSGKEVFADYLGVAKQELGDREPTGAEMAYILGRADRNKTGWLSESNIRDATREYYNLITDEDAVRKANLALNVMDAGMADLQSQIKKNEAAMTRQIRQGKAWDVPAALRARTYNVPSKVEEMRKTIRDIN